MMRWKQVTFTVVLICMAYVVSYAMAQDDADGAIVYGYTGNAENFNFTGSQYYCTSSDCWTITGAMSVGLFAVDADIGWYKSNGYRALVDGWELTESNQVLTLYLRDDLYWSDGTQITSADLMMGHVLQTNPDANRSSPAAVTQYNSIVGDVEMPDEHTFVIRFQRGSCQALWNTQLLFYIVPAHIYQPLIDEVGYAELRNHPYFEAPSVISGMYQFGEVTDEYDVILNRNESFTDTPSGVVPATGFIQTLIAPDITPEEFLERDVNVLSSIGDGQKAAFSQAAADGLLQVYEYPQDQVNMMAMNTADSENPKPALNDEGQRIDQGKHPLFGDSQVRQAIAHAIDLDQMIESVLDGYGVRTNAYLTPWSWAYNNELPLVPYDPEVALELLSDAGWILEDPSQPASADNRLVCQDCQYAQDDHPEFAGQPFEFTLLASEARLSQAEFIQSQLEDTGITVHIDTQDFFGQLIGQTYDAALIGLAGGYPHNPVTDDWFGAIEDVPGGGINFTSYYNEAFFALEETALTIPGCGVSERAEIYRQMQSVIREDMPFVFLYSPTGMYVAKNEVQGFDPRPNNLWWNIGTWHIATDQ